MQKVFKINLLLILVAFLLPFLQIEFCASGKKAGEQKREDSLLIDSLMRDSIAKVETEQKIKDSVINCSSGKAKFIKDSLKNKLADSTVKKNDVKKESLIKNKSNESEDKEYNKLNFFQKIIYKLFDTGEDDIIIGYYIVYLGLFGDNCLLISATFFIVLLSIGLFLFNYKKQLLQTLLMLAGTSSLLIFNLTAKLDFKVYKKGFWILLILFSINTIIGIIELIKKYRSKLKETTENSKLKTEN
ncbi:MAG: hypothetical protein PHD97_07320 [Bacteroidales bacterium]|nr:hypothetical protein [Bacteroidales bacterium]